MNRLYAIESTPTLTGAKADHRLALRASEIQAAAQALSSGGSGGSFSNANAQKFLAAVAKDLQAHRGRSLVVAGDYQPAAVHQLARALNESLGNAGTTVTYAPAVTLNPTDQIASLRELTQAMDGGQVQLLVILGAQSRLHGARGPQVRREARRRSRLSVSHSLYVDETASSATGTCRKRTRSKAGATSRARRHRHRHAAADRAALRRTHGPRSAGDFIEAQSGKTAHDLVKDYWTRAHGGEVGSWTITDPTGQPFKSTDSFWKHVLHDGWMPGTAVEARPAAARQLPGRQLPAIPAANWNGQPAAGSQSGSGLEIIFRPDPTIWDGRFANNGWLQELPKPLTKITWDPTAWVSPRLAESQQPARRRHHRAALSRQHREAAGRDRAGPSRQLGDRVLRLRPPGRRPRRHRRTTTTRRTSTSSGCARLTRRSSAPASRSRRPAAAMCSRGRRNIT